MGANKVLSDINVNVVCHQYSKKTFFTIFGNQQLQLKYDKRKFS